MWSNWKNSEEFFCGLADCNIFCQITQSKISIFDFVKIVTPPQVKIIPYVAPVFSPFNIAL